jgi:ribose-phosphate pyrophosphokinase
MATKTTIIPTIRAEHLAHKMELPKDYELVLPLGNKEGQRFFPDEEVYVRLPDEFIKREKSKDRIVVLHSGMPDPNAGLVELQMILNILSKTKARVEVFFAYFPYGMQDHASHIGETNAAEDLISKLCSYYKVKKIYTLDAHFFGHSWVKKYPIKNISPLELLHKEVKKDYPNAVFMAPDAGSKRRTKLKGTEKKRSNSFDVTIHSDDDFKKSVKGKVVCVVDDLVETGGTVAKFADECRACGATDLVALITHGVLVSGIKRLKIAYNELYLTNSIKREDSNVDISGLILDSIIL